MPESRSLLLKLLEILNDKRSKLLCRLREVVRGAPGQSEMTPTARLCNGKDADRLCREIRGTAHHEVRDKRHPQASHDQAANRLDLVALKNDSGRKTRLATEAVGQLPKDIPGLQTDKE
ncbi:hypothetical protein Krac_11408 [Ktedonobacter racemifer DSM 44963]|uniref:Uncharacterized protein n=1 Tax=Ktedonobacter racemifer DSM 44963 TaxID=485913 RepID=D6TBP8_KTERA|nr:hypothetical protein Krac_11408 [Ktedonobacter racemifer DSM 44963]